MRIVKVDLRVATILKLMNPSNFRLADQESHRFARNIASESHFVRARPNLPTSLPRFTAAELSDFGFQRFTEMLQRRAEAGAVGVVGIDGAWWIDRWQRAGDS